MQYVSTLLTARWLLYNTFFSQNYKLRGNNNIRIFNISSVSSDVSRIRGPYFSPQKRPFERSVVYISPLLNCIVESLHIRPIENSTHLHIYIHVCVQRMTRGYSPALIRKYILIRKSQRSVSNRERREIASVLFETAGTKVEGAFLYPRFIGGVVSKLYRF